MYIYPYISTFRGSVVCFVAILKKVSICIWGYKKKLLLVFIPIIFQAQASVSPPSVQQLLGNHCKSK